MDGWMDGQTGDTAAANVVFIMINMMTKWQISDMSDEEYIYTHTHGDSYNVAAADDVDNHDDINDEEVMCL